MPEELLRDLLPGPVTLVLPRSDALNADLNPFTPVSGGRAAFLGLGGCPPPSPGSTGRLPERRLPLAARLSLPFLQLVGVRVPNHHFVRELARACDGPLALTSANVSERASSLTVTVRTALALAPQHVWSYSWALRPTALL